MKVSTVTFKVPSEPIPDADSNDWMRSGTHADSHLGARPDSHLGARAGAHSGARGQPYLHHRWHSGVVPFGAGRAATQGQQRRWLAAKRWRFRVQAALRGSGLSFMQWLILDATAALIATTGDAVSQGDVAGYLELSRMAVSRAMGALAAKGLVSRGGSMSGPAWRIFMTKDGMNLLFKLAGSIESVSAAC